MKIKISQSLKDDKRYNKIYIFSMDAQEFCNFSSLFFKRRGIVGLFFFGMKTCGLKLSFQWLNLDQIWPADISAGSFLWSSYRSSRSFDNKCCKKETKTPVQRGERKTLHICSNCGHDKSSLITVHLSHFLFYERERNSHFMILFQP